MAAEDVLGALGFRVAVLAVGAFTATAVPPFSLAAIARITCSETPDFIMASVDSGRRSKSKLWAVETIRINSASLTPAKARPMIFESLNVVDCCAKMQPASIIATNGFIAQA